MYNKSLLKKSGLGPVLHSSIQFEFVDWIKLLQKFNRSKNWPQSTSLFNPELSGSLLLTVINQIRSIVLSTGLVASTGKWGGRKIRMNVIMFHWNFALKRK